jgi:hypothetical protein
MQERPSLSTQELQDRAIHFVRRKSVGVRPIEDYEITVNFHPDRKTETGAPVLSVLAKDSLLKSQFETKTSNGGLTAYGGGDRWKWEHAAFGGTYDHCAPQQRPKYGALNFGRETMGASPRFGSACFRLKPHVLERATFCYPDSHLNPKDFTTYEHVVGLIELARLGELDVLDNYVEAHIHGLVDLNNDVEAVVLDPAYRGSVIEDQAKTLPCRVEWHSGFELHVSVVENNPAYRGARYVQIALELAKDGVLTPPILGAAIESGDYAPQDIKKVWHYLAKFGYAQDQA